MVETQLSSLSVADGLLIELLSDLLSLVNFFLACVFLTFRFWLHYACLY